MAYHSKEVILTIIGVFCAAMIVGCAVVVVITEVKDVDHNKEEVPISSQNEEE